MLNIDPGVAKLIKEALASGQEDAINLAYELAEDPLTYINSPALYAQNILKVSLWAKQQEIAEALLTHRRVIVNSAHALGKSYIASILALWFFETRKPSITILTAPTLRQVKDVLFKEIRKQYKGYGLYPKQSRIYDTEDHYIYGFTATSADSFQGIHGEELLIIFDEHNGMQQWAWEAVEGILSGGGYWLCIGNPTDSTSEAYRQQQTGNWYVINISGLEHPNIVNCDTVIKGAITTKEFDRLVKLWCDVGEEDANNLLWQNVWYKPGPIAEARLLGRYPSESAYAIFNEYWFDTEEKQPDKLDKVSIGCDVARYGMDFTSIHVRQGNVSLHHESYNGKDTVFTAKRLKDLCEGYGGKNACKIACRIDDCGVGGGVVDQRGKYRFIAVNNSTLAQDEESYPNKRSEALFNLADKLKNNKLSLTKLPYSTIQELKRQASGVQYKLDHKGRRVAESKDDQKKRLGRSPDDLDSICLAYSDYGTLDVGKNKLVMPKKESAYDKVKSKEGPVIVGGKVLLQDKARPFANIKNRRER